MPYPSRFFCISRKNNNHFSIPAAFEDHWVPVQIVAKQAELFFGINAAQLEDFIRLEEFALFYLTGFHIIYGLTKKDCYDSDKIHVVHLKELNEFLLAETFEAKKMIFLSHGENLIRRYLRQKQLSEVEQECIQPIIDYVLYDFELIAVPLLKKRSQIKRSEQLMDNLKPLGRYLKELSMVAMNLHTLVSSEKKEFKREHLEELIKRITKFKIENRVYFEDEITELKENAISEAISRYDHYPHTYLL